MSDWWARRMAPEDAPRTGYPQTAPTPRPALPPLPVRAPETSPDIQVTASNLHQTATMWAGGEGTQTETQSCPQCRSDLYFSRANTAAVMTTRGSVSPSPRCYSCGYTQARPNQGMPQ